jgi:methylated-DNA-[protein]-cysteine S-methyltransferase
MPIKRPPNSILSFTEQVQSVVKTIPKGQTLTYKAVASLVGKPKAARAVANIMAANYQSDIPCHRVIRSDGSLGGYNRGGEVAKRKLLLSEGWTPKGTQH